jgi:hypothetical protein
MAMYRCHEEFVDNDWHPMSEDGLCPACQAEKDEKKQAREYEISQRHAAWITENQDRMQ